MNTHLHVLESFANLYTIWPDEQLKNDIRELVSIFFDHIISRETNHLVLFFNDEWISKSSTISYGHDIEAAWLIQDAIEIIGDKMLLQQAKKYSMSLVKAASKGLDADGGLWYEYEPATGMLINQKHSWPQAEAMIGFFNAWEITGEEKYLQQSLRSWRFVQEFICDKKGGEWKWGVNEDYSTMDKEDKVGIWKCPYHNSRSCIEIVKRVTGMMETGD
jgi:mannobiose 2-epimerase